MRVLHVIPVIAPRYGGTSSAVSGLCDALNRRADVVAELAATDADGPDRFTTERWAVPNTKLHLFPAAGGVRTLRSGELNEWLRRHTADYDVVHTHGVWNQPVYTARKTAVAARRPLVFMPHGMLSDYTWTRNRALKTAYWLARERGNVAAAAAVHCTSEGEAAEVRRYRAVRGAVHVIPLGLEPAAWSAPVERDELRRRCGPAADGKPIILFLSRLHPKKGLTDFLLPAVARMKTPAFLAVVGGPDDKAVGYEDEVRRCVARLGLESRVALLGPVPPSERWAMFDGADVFALTSHQENFGMVVAEAMARGCPPVVSEQVLACEHVRAAAAGVVTPLAVEPVATALDRVLGDPAERAAMAERGRVYVRDRLSWDAITGRVVAMYQECVGAGR